MTIASPVWTRRQARVRKLLLAMVALASFGVTAKGTVAAAPESSGEVPVWLRGVWVRDWIEEGHGKSDTLDVHYLQTPTYYADMRIPRGRPSFENAKSFADLTDQQLRTLAEQNGFTGLTTLTGAVATWNHDIQYRPSDGTPDQGRLQRTASDRMQEHGLDGSYTESWQSPSRGNGSFLVVRVEHDGRLLKTLVVVGDRFVYVRNRSKDLPPAASFDVLFESTKATRKQIEDYLDCEFSVGRVHGGKVPWAIERSTLPWREGRHLEFVDELAVVQGTSGLVSRTPDGNQWLVPVNTLGARQLLEWFRKQ